jgi:hypothetical protein
MLKTKILRSEEAGKVPSASSFLEGQFAYNITDQKIYAKTSGNVVTLIGVGSLAALGVSASAEELDRCIGLTAPVTQLLSELESRVNPDGNYLPLNGTAYDSERLGGLLASDFSPASHNHDTDYSAIDHNHNALYFKIDGSSYIGDLNVDNTTAQGFSKVTAVGSTSAGELIVTNPEQSGSIYANTVFTARDGELLTIENTDGTNVNTILSIDENGMYVNGSQVITVSNAGGSGVDASTLAGYSADDFVKSEEDDIINANLTFATSMQLRFGNNADMRMWSDGINAYCRVYKAGADLILQGRNTAGSTVDLMKADPNNSAYLCYAGAWKLKTTASGLEVSGGLTVSSTTLCSNLNADLLDGKHASAFSLVGHDHGSTYSLSTHTHANYVSSTSDDSSTGRLTISRNIGSASVYSTGQLVLQNTDAGDVTLGFHRSGYTACALKHEGSGLRLCGTTDTAVANFYATGDVTAFSDARLKENLEIITNPIEKISSLNGYTFDRVNSESSGRYTGLIAQEVKEVLPEAVKTNEGDGYLSIAYGNLAGLFVEGFKAVVDENKKLKQRVDALEEKLERLLSAIEG